MGKRRAKIREARAHAMARLREVALTGERAAIIGRRLTDNPVKARYTRQVRFRFSCGCGTRHSLGSLREDVVYRCECGRIYRVELSKPPGVLGGSWSIVGVALGIAGLPAHDDLLVAEATVATVALRRLW